MPVLVASKWEAIRSKPPIGGTLTCILRDGPPSQTSKEAAVKQRTALGNSRQLDAVGVRGCLEEEIDPQVASHKCYVSWRKRTHAELSMAFRLARWLAFGFSA